MALESTLTEIIDRLRREAFPNEQAVSQGVVLPLLQELGWNIWDTNTVWPEFQTGEGRVDFALCHPASKPAVFIEVKQLGRAEDGVRQALEYAFHTGVPFIVLTDGKTWAFYLPAEQGSYEDRRVYKLDLLDREISETSAILRSYLARRQVEAGKALDNARKDYHDLNRRNRARDSIPNAWNELVDKGDELLIELIANAVETKAGVRPEADDIVKFLSNLILPSTAFTSPVPSPEPNPKQHVTLAIKGKQYRLANAKQAMVRLLRELAKTDSTFFQRCSQHKDFHGRKRNYIARSIDELYPDRPDLRDYNEPLPDGWFVATNLNNQLKKTIIKAATEVAGLSFGKDVNVNF